MCQKPTVSLPTETLQAHFHADQFATLGIRCCVADPVTPFGRHPAQQRRFAKPRHRTAATMSYHPYSRRSSSPREVERLWDVVPMRTNRPASAQDRQSRRADALAPDATTLHRPSRASHPRWRRRDVASRESTIHQAAETVYRAPAVRSRPTQGNRSLLPPRTGAVLRRRLDR